ncbi:MAG: type IV pilus assembly [Geobacteraceae bacterium]|nr:MAG: type IV pilus assembly [Geobacteraceae bacterium]
MEKRKFSRVDFNLKAFVSYRNLSIKGEVENLSLKGMFVRTGEKLQSGDMVETTIYLTGTANPLDISVNIKGTVVRTEGNGVVLQFKEMDLDSFAQLKNIIAYNDGNADKVMDEFVQAIDKSAAD